jgi:hypothetical protein
MTKRKDSPQEFLKEAERIEREEIQIEDEEAEGRWVFVRPRPAKEPSQVYSVRLPATVVEELRVLAAAKGAAPTALIRDWLLERLDEEIDRLPSARERTRVERTTGRKAGTGSKTGIKKTAAVRAKRSAAKKESGSKSTPTKSRRSGSRSR